MTTLSHKIELSPTPSQVRSLSRAAGCARFSWNWGLGEWNRRYEATKVDSTLPKPTIKTVKEEWARVKHEAYPWLAESPANANLQPFVYLDDAFKRFFMKKARHPRFKKKGVHDSFYVDNQKMKLDGRRVHLPKIGKVKLTEPLRFSGKVLRGTVSRTAGRWFLSVSIELKDGARKRVADEVVGVDLGLTNFATLSTGETIENPRALRNRLTRLRRISRQHSRKVKGFANRLKATKRLAKLHWRIRNVRQDSIHKLTTQLCRENQAVGIEDLNVTGMLKNRRLSRAISDAGWGEFRRQMTYKAPLYGTLLVVVPRFYPSSKTCSGCGVVKKTLLLSERTFCCNCDLTIDRDVNAAINLRAKAQATLGMRGSNACGELVRPGGFGPSAALDEAGSRIGS